MFIFKIFGKNCHSAALYSDWRILMNLQKKIAKVLIFITMGLSLTHCPAQDDAFPYWMFLLLGGNSSSDGSGGGTTEPGTVTAPVFSPTAGTYGTDQSITIASSTDGASIFYTTDGTTPATSVTGSTLQYSGNIEVNGNGTNTTITAIAVKSGMTESTVASADYTINYEQVSTPQFSPAAGTFTSDQSVTITSSTVGTSIFYTTDGTEPATSAGGSTLTYSGAIPVTGNNTTKTIKAIAVKSGLSSSTVATAAYTITYPAAATPTFSPSAGTYSTDQSVALSSTTVGATIFYTTDDSTPATSASGSTSQYSSAIAVNGNGTNTTIKAIAITNGFSSSAVATALYTINYDQVSTPQFSPAAGTYTSDQSVTITSSTSGTSIFYTTDGTTPATSVTGTTLQYSSAIPVNGDGTSMTIKAIAVKSGMDNSTVASGIFTITYPAVATPAFSPSAGTFSSDQSVTITSSTSGATIFYTTDGTNPATSVTGTTSQYSSAIPVNGNGTSKTIKAIAVATGYSSSAIASAAYTIDYGTVSTPQFSPAAGTYTSDQSVTITTSTSGATIYYTTDGSTPTTSSSVYSSAISVAGDGTSKTIKALAVKSGMSNSTIESATYNIRYNSTPVISPDAGTYTKTFMAGISADVGTTIYYTTDGTDPDCSGTDDRYSHVIAIESTTTVRAISCGNGNLPSEVTESVFTITSPAAPLFSVAPGSYTSGQLVGLETLAPVNMIYYTNDGTVPTCDGTNGLAYFSPIEVKEAVTLKAIACGGGGLVSAVGSASYDVSLSLGSIQMGGGIIGTELDFVNSVSTFAGKNYFADGFGLSARFQFISGVVNDGTNLYIVDYYFHVVRKMVIATGEVTTFAGTPGNSGSTNGIGQEARFNYPAAITTDGTNLFIADSQNHRIRKIAIATAEVTTLASAGFSNPWGVTTDGTNVYVANTNVCEIKKVVIATGSASTFAGQPGSCGSTDGTGTGARFSYPRAITSDGTNLYVSDTENRTIRKIAIATVAVTTMAGTAGVSGSSDGTGSAAKFENPWGIATDGSKVYIDDTGTIRELEIGTGVVTTVAGTAWVYGSADGTGASVEFGGMSSDCYGSNYKGLNSLGSDLYITDACAGTVRKMDLVTKEVSTLAGKASAKTGSTDGVGNDAMFAFPSAITSDGSNLYMADTGNSTIRKIQIATGTVSTFAGTAGSSGYLDGTGPAAKFNNLTGITTDGINLYALDASNFVIRQVDIASQVVTTLAGTTGSSGHLDGIGTAAKFTNLGGITTDGTSVFVGGGTVIRQIDIASGAVTTLAGTYGSSGSVDGVGANARFKYISAITTDGTALFVSDSNDQTIRKVVIATGEVTTLAGYPGSSGSSNGIATAARFKSPFGISTDGTNLYVCDVGNNQIRKIVIATREVTTIVGTAGTYGFGVVDGPGSFARFRSPMGITTDGKNLYVADRDNSSIRRIQ
jgi:sugar lactone lactonase YvrE/AraC-like DNA-binding protein